MRGNLRLMSLTTAAAVAVGLLTAIASDGAAGASPGAQALSRPTRTHTTTKPVTTTTTKPVTTTTTTKPVTTTTTTKPVTTTTTTSPVDRGVLVEVPRDAPAVVDLSRGFAVGTIFSVSLYENPSTGYTWTQSVPAGSTGSVVLLGSDYVQDPAPSGWAGVGGTRYFRYLVQSQGVAKISFSYLRPWETGIPPIKQVTLTVSS